MPFDKLHQASEAERIRLEQASTYLRAHAVPLLRELGRSIRDRVHSRIVEDVDNGRAHAYMCIARAPGKELFYDDGIHMYASDGGEVDVAVVRFNHPNDAYFMVATGIAWDDEARLESVLTDAYTGFVTGR